MLTPEGSQAIEEIQPGDFVLARSEVNLEGPVIPKRVEEVFVDDAPILNLNHSKYT